MRSAAYLAALGLVLASATTAVLAQATMPGHAPKQPEVQVKPPGRGSFFGPVTGLGEGRFSNGDRYEGELKNGKPDGFGKMHYMLGGSYEGEWKNGRRNGKGVMAFAGSGRLADVRFVDDRRVDVATESPPKAMASDAFSLLSDDEPVGSHIRNKVVYGPLPLDRGFDELTPEQQRFVRSWYPALDAGDNPPYPLSGGKELYKLLVSMIRHIGVKDEILVYVAVDAEGSVTSVTTISTLDPKQKDLIAAAAGLLRYKPAQCGGRPCAGVVPFNLNMRPVI
jgi:hypothetical protein